MQRDVQPTLVSFFYIWALDHQSQQCSGGKKSSERRQRGHKVEARNHEQFGVLLSKWASCSNPHKEVWREKIHRTLCMFDQCCESIHSSADSCWTQAAINDDFFLSCSCVKWQGLHGYQCCCCFAFNVKRFFSHLHFEVAAYGKYINITFLISFVLKADTHSTIQLSGKIQTPNTFHCSDNYHRFPDRTLFKFGWNMFHFDLQVELRFTKVGD